MEVSEPMGIQPLYVMKPETENLPAQNSGEQLGTVNILQNL